MTLRSLQHPAVALRRAFDESFAKPRERASDDVEDLLLVQVAQAPFALRLEELAGVAKPAAIVAVPSRRPELLGLAGIRGTLVCVYGMASLLGFAGRARRAPWLAICRAAAAATPADAGAVALAFDVLDGFRRVPRSQLQDQGEPSTTLFLRGLVKIESVARPVIDVRAMLDVVERSAGSSRSHSKGG